MDNNLQYDKCIRRFLGKNVFLEAKSIDVINKGEHLREASHIPSGGPSRFHIYIFPGLTNQFRRLSNSDHMLAGWMGD